ncbi:hypothetical protein J6590_031432 [Homalodisca vitripennis]|nr:hypothetical protein J6590_031432 [Homalodisca vitripennis]
MDVDTSLSRRLRPVKQSGISAWRLAKRFGFGLDFYECCFPHTDITRFEIMLTETDTTCRNAFE